MIVSLLLLSWYIYFSGKDSHLVFIYPYTSASSYGAFCLCYIFLKKALSENSLPPLPALISSVNHFFHSSLIFSIIFLNHFLAPPLQFPFSLPFLLSDTSSVHWRIFTVPLNHNSQEQMDRDKPLNNETSLV